MRQNRGCGRATPLSIARLRERLGEREQRDARRAMLPRFAPAPALNTVTGTLSAAAMRCSRPAETRLSPFSYF